MANFSMLRYLVNRLMPFSLTLNTRPVEFSYWAGQTLRLNFFIPFSTPTS